MVHKKFIFLIGMLLTLLPVGSNAQTAAASWFLNCPVGSSCGSGGAGSTYPRPYGTGSQAPDINTSYISSATNLSAGSGVNIYREVSGGIWATYWEVENVNSCTFAQAKTNGDFVAATITIAAGAPLIRVSELRALGVSGAGISTGTYQFGVTITDLTAGTAEKTVATGGQVTEPNTAPGQGSATSSSATLNATVTDAYLLAGHQYRVRWYFYNITVRACIDAGVKSGDFSGNTCSTPQSGRAVTSCTSNNKLGLDNPIILVSTVPVTTVSGSVLNDNNGQTGGVNGAASSGTTVTLYAADGVTVVATTTTNASGNYSFPDVVASSSYIVAVTPPAGFRNVSSSNGVTPTDGRTTIAVGTTPATGISFGINQPPTAANDVKNNQPPGSVVTITNLLTNDSDPNSGTLSPDSISLVAPTGATAVVVDAQGDTTGFTVPGQGTWSLNSSTGALTFTPQSGFTGSPTPINYTVTDGAGLKSAPATVTINVDPPVPVSGTVYNDNNGTTGGPNGTAMAGVSVTLYASDGTTVLATTTTDASGNYSFPGQVPGSYVVGITPPAGYQHVSSTDLTPADGKTTVTVGSTAVAGVNFGINQPPTAANDVLNNQPPGSPVTVANLLVNDTDPGGAALSPDSISLVAPAGATAVVVDGQGDTTGFTVPGQGAWSLNSSTGALTFTPQSGFTGSPTPINYTVTDAAGLKSAPATVTINVDPPVPVSGTVYNDNNGTTAGPGGTAMANVLVTLYASNGTTVLATTTTDASGNYSFPGQVPGSYVVGITPPAGYQHVSSTDLTPADGKTTVTVGSTAVAGVNFGINQPPTAADDILNNQPPGSVATIANLLTNDNDPNSGTLSPDSISLVAPAGATGVVVDAQGDTTGFTVPGQGTWSLNSSTGALTFTPQSGFTGSPTPINYTVTDAAGLKSAPATVTINVNPPVPVSGTVYNDNNGTTAGPGGTAMAGVSVTLYASNGTTVLATTTTDASGNYSFPGQVPGSYVVGITPPAGYQHVSSTDLTPADGKTMVAVGSMVVAGVNFGINQPPTAADDVLNNQPAGLPATLPNLLVNDTDPGGAALSPDSISLVAPAGATNVVVDAQGDTTGFTVPGQGAWSLNSSTGALTFTPQAGYTGSPTAISYTVTDAAGLTSNVATVAINFVPVPDLTPTIVLPVNQLGTGASRDFIVRLNELKNVPTGSPIAINIAVPTGYTLSFNNATTSVQVLLSGTYNVSNTNWTAYVHSSTNMSLQSQSGFQIDAMSNTVLGFKLTRTSALAGSQGNITVSIFADPNHTYDSVPSNNFYSRIISSN